MKRIDNRRILYDCRGLASGNNNNNISPHWPKVRVTASMMRNNKDSDLSCAEDNVSSALGDITLIEIT
ncbi:hypothetical protein [Paraglaciecola sp. 25GB23A]|uniref:hypothetical protein n=1 Tax=Paraglaciecola sp. 25GB23A TaxID=3156068 RepID=UPI0032AF85B8